jgi:hypothetical protein
MIFLKLKKVKIWVKKFIIVIKQTKNVKIINNKIKSISEFIS